MEDWQLDEISEISQRLYDLAKQHKRECGECGDWATLDDAAEMLAIMVYESRPPETDPMTLLKQRMEDAL